MKLPTITDVQFIEIESKLLATLNAAVYEYKESLSAENEINEHPVITEIIGNLDISLYEAFKITHGKTLYEWFHTRNLVDFELEKSKRK